ncbi:hypothetical protein [Sorangium cellulosum]|uniref:hypothetical protein n=1 Tax=Sorangium TaxID=39643 RepID=UPI0012DB5F05|nr:hypothetical protein [Sorangium cellulosum]
MIEGALKGTANLDPRPAPEGTANADFRLTGTLTHPICISIDAVADNALRARQATSGATELRCDVCDTAIEGEPAGRGLYMWSRGEELRFEEPALCGGCAVAIGMTALSAWNVEEEEG